MPGRLMVGRMALDHVVKVRVLPGQPLFYRSNYMSTVVFSNLSDVNLDMLREMIEHAGKITTENHS